MCAGAAAAAAAVLVKPIQLIFILNPRPDLFYSAERLSIKYWLVFGHLASVTFCRILRLPPCFHGCGDERL